MQITIGNDSHGDPVAHVTGCQHTGRLERDGGLLRFEADSHEGVVAWFYDDQLAEAGEEARDNLWWVPLAPCLRKVLPAYEKSLTSNEEDGKIDPKDATEASEGGSRMSEQLTVSTPEARVKARTYVVKRSPELQGKVGSVVRTDGSDIFVQFDGEAEARSMKASHLMLDRDGAKGPAVQPGKASDADEPVTHPALDPNSEEITDEQLADLRRKQAEAAGMEAPPEGTDRQRLIFHLLHPGEDHDHGKLEVGEGTAKSASFADLRKWHGNGHKLTNPDDQHAV